MNGIYSKSEKKLKEILEMKNITIRKLDRGILASEAIDEYNRLNSGNPLNLETVSSHKLDHIMLNYIRHHLVAEYHHLLAKYFKDFGNNKIYFETYSKISYAIIEVYPFLKTAMYQQLHQKRLIVKERMDNEKKAA